MKTTLKIGTLLLIMALAIVVLTGCGVKKEELIFDGEEGKITFSVKTDSNPRISTDKEDLRTSREQGALVTDNYKIGIEFCDDYNYFFDSNLDKLKEARKDYDEYKEVKYGGVEGVQYFSGGYMCYEIILPVQNNDKYYLNLSVYGNEDNEASAKEAISSQDVIDVLNSIKFEAK